MLNEINKILKINDSYQAPQKIMDILYGDIKERNKVFNQMSELFDNNYSFDWFHEYFQNEHADRKVKKQDFTPRSVSEILNKLSDNVIDDGTRLDIAAGTGGLTITRWEQDRMKFTPFTYRPSFFFYTLEDLSDRSIPFLLFNLVIRGMNALVVHGDSLTRDAYGVFFVQNDNDDMFEYSSLNLMPYSELTEKEFNVKFIEEKYEPLQQSKYPSARLMDYKSWYEQLCKDEKVESVLLYGRDTKEV